MPTLQIESQGCRACSLCVDTCPTKVFDLEPVSQVAKATRQDDCIGCCSCEVICPSRCLTVTDTARQLPFYRLDQAGDLVSRFLQQQPSRVSIAESDVQSALADVKTRLRALGDSATETMGRGLKVVGRTAGTLAAAHLPDLYEQTTVPALLERLQIRFAGSFPFTFQTASDNSVSFAFTNCSMKSIVKDAGAELGADALCLLFHEYWAGLIGEFSRNKFMVASNGQADPCTFSITAK